MNRVLSITLALSFLLYACTSHAGEIPVNITKAKISNPSAPLVILFSGDGGWKTFTVGICENLAAKGVNIVGIDSYKYFSSRKTPKQTALDITALFKKYGKEFGTDNFSIIGFSMGAEVIPFVYEALSPEIRQKIKGMGLISAAPFGDFEVHYSNMLGLGHKSNTFDVVSAIKRLPATLPLLVTVGKDEKSELPTKLQSLKPGVVILPGDHYYNDDAKGLVNLLVKSKVI